ncbi:MAG: High-affinity branched-chain amino acid transport ATP-binding protein LivF [Deltaproteobacteria bacterium]|jgi:branched-chain amino acid transport system ATP-binding protein|nr:High-affinity branched-chain amino acid transport ATP-binding protein LivF [Deltaproteobacteria bacterium]
MASVELLSTHGLSRQYGGLTAVDNVDFNFCQDRIQAIIGPNGAGKTTLVNLICGRVPPSSGSIIYKGKDISKLSSAKRVQSGIVYTFQVTSIFSNLSCYENVALSAQRSLKTQQGKWLMVSETVIEEQVFESLSRVGLQGKEYQTAGTLPYGHQKLLEVAMSLAADPELLILDEPTQGLAQSEIYNLIGLVRTISKSVNVLLIEHNMEVVFNLAEYVTVMDNGSIMTEGTPSEIENNHDVQVLYLGT